MPSSSSTEQPLSHLQSALKLFSETAPKLQMSTGFSALLQPWVLTPFSEEPLLLDPQSLLERMAAFAVEPLPKLLSPAKRRVML